MIHFLVHRAHRYTIDAYLRDWAGPLREQIEVITYEELRRPLVLRDGVYIFGDIERLSAPMTRIASEFFDHLSRRGDAVRVLNHPERSLRRFDLLEMLHRLGQNQFRAYRIGESTTPARFPVFLRLASQHSANLTPLLHSRAEVDAHVQKVSAEIQADGYKMSDLLMVEFLDTSDGEGVFRRYGTYLVEDRTIPRQVNFSHHWVVKHPKLLEQRRFEEEDVYLRTNPHQQELLAIAREADIQFGRFDYSFVEGRLQVWEMNTNPGFGRPRRRVLPAQLPFVDRFANLLGSAFQDLARRYPSTGKFSFTPSPALVEESLRPEHRPPAFVHVPETLEPVTSRIPKPIRRVVRRVAATVIR